MTARQRRLLRQRAKGIYCFLWNYIAFPVFGLGELLENYLSQKYFTKGCFHSVRIIDADFDRDLRFLPMTLEALALVENYDSRRFRRVLREVRRIDYDDKRTLYTGVYRRATHSCGVNFQKMVANLGKETDPNYEKKYEWFVAYYASLIVHEATHGHLISLGFAYDRHTRVRSERICAAEQCRFAARIPSAHHDFAKCLVEPYDPAHWQAYWNRTYWQRWKAHIKASREVLGEIKAEYRKP